MKTVRKGGEQAPETATPTGQHGKIGGRNAAHSRYATLPAPAVIQLQETDSPAPVRAPEAEQPAAINPEQMQARIQEHAAAFAGMSPGPELCDEVGREVDTWIGVHGQRLVLDSIRAAGWLDTWLRGMSAQMQARFTSQLNVTDVDQSIAPEERIRGQPNEDRARRALQQIQALQASRDPNQDRITAGIIDVLVRAVAEPRTNDPNGEEGLLGIYQAVQATRTLIMMLQSDYTSIVARLAMSGGGAGTDIQTQNALILKAVAARQAEYVARARNNGPVAGAADPDAAVTAFADQISGMENNELIKNTSLIDLDASDGELGTRQRFTMSCAPTTAIMGRGEMDPVYAMTLRGNSDVSDNQQAHDPMADEQRRLLEAYGASSPGATGQARAIVAETELPNLQGRIGALMGAATPAQQQGMVQVWRFASNQPFNAGQMATGLAHIRANHAGFPSGQLLADMREYSGRTNVGLTDPQTEQLMQDHIGTGTGTTVDTDTSIGTTRTTKQLLDAAAVALDQGLDVPFGVTWAAGGGHVMLMSNVRATAGTTHSFLISDPATGNTAWVTEPNILASNLTALGLGAGLVDATWIQVPDVPLQAEFPRPTLREGARGPSVNELQRLLNHLGGESLKVDAWFGPLTKAAVVRFQRSSSVGIDGIVGEDTWAALEGQATPTPASPAPAAPAAPATP